MTTAPFIVELSHFFPSEDWPWVLMALRQERRVWQALEVTPLAQLAMQKLGQDARYWTPAALGLLSLGAPLTPAELRQMPLPPIGDDLRSLAEKAWEDWLAVGLQPASPNPSPSAPDDKRESPIEAQGSALATCALLALALRERYRQNSTWRGLLAEINLNRPEVDTLLACLYGLIPEPQRLLSVLLLQGENRPRSDLALHIMLSQPTPEDELEQALQTLLADQPMAQVIAVLGELSALRPGLAVRLAEALLAEGWTNWPEEPSGAAETAVNLGQTFDHLALAIRQAQIYQLANQPDRAVPLLAETLRSMRRLRGHLSACLAQVVGRSQGSGDEAWRETAQETSLEAWKQAVQLAPDAPQYTAGLVNALIASGRLDDAQNYLARCQSDDRHAVLLLAAARLANAQGDDQLAKQHTLQALRLVESGQRLSENEYIVLGNLLYQAGLYAELARAAHAGLEHYPMNRDLLLQQAVAQFAVQQPAKALLSVYTALASGAPKDETRLPGGKSLQMLLIETLEAVGAWSTALEERKALLAKIETPALEDWYALMHCAEQARQPDVLEEACQRVLELSPQDVLARQYLGQAAQARGDDRAAIEHFVEAIRLSPDQPEIWLSLVGAYRRLGQEAQAVETLRAASQATPDCAEIHKELGDAYLAQSALTQALACYRRAAELAPTEANLLNLGQTLLDLGHFEEARQTLSPLYQGDPTGAHDPNLIYAYARSFLGLGETESAIPLLLEVIRQQPEKPQPALELARAFLRSPAHSGRAQQAIPFLQRILGQTPDGEEGGYQGESGSSPVMRAEARALLAEAYTAAGEWSRAMEAYRRALDDPHNRKTETQTRLSAGLGLVALKLDQPEMAIAALQEAIQAEPSNAELQRSLSEAYLASGLTADAFQTACAAWDLQPEDLNTINWFIRQAQRLLEQPGVKRSLLVERLIRAFEAASRSEPGRADHLTRMANLQMEMGDKAGALQTLHRLGSLESDLDGVTVDELRYCAQAARRLGDASLAIDLLNRAIPLCSKEERATASALPAIALVDVFRDLAATYQEVGEDEKALQMVEQALALNEADPQLHAYKAELHDRLGDAQSALDSIRTAVEISPRDPVLRRRAAILLRQKGDLPAALEQVENALEVLEPPSKEGQSDETTASLRNELNRMAAHLAYATLRPRRAQRYLDAGLSADDPANHEFANAALRAEISLDLGDLAAAEAAALTLARQSPAHPRTEAILSRIAGRRLDPEDRNRRCRSAVRSLLQQQLNQPPITPPSTREEYIASFLSVAQAAMESRQWDDALATLKRLIEIIPETPLAYFKIAQIGVLRGEAQCLCQDLEVVRHAVGAELLSVEARQMVEDNLSKAQSYLGVDFNVDVLDDFKKWDDECRQTLGVWMARARALFKAETRSARVLEAMLRMTPASADGLASLIMAYRRSGQPQAAAAAMQIGWQPPFDGKDMRANPLVMTQLALAETDAGQALTSASQALEASLALADDWPPLPMLEFLVARLAYRLGKLEAAMQAIQQAIAVWPDEPRWQELAARIFMSPNAALGLPDHVKALVHLEQAAALDPEQAETHQAIGKIYLMGSQIPRALQALERASQLDPTSPDTWLALARAQYAAGELEKAAASAERAAQGVERPWEAILLQGRIALQTHDPRRAFAHAQSILRETPDHPEALYLLARALEELNRPADALTALERAMTLSENPLPMQIERAHLARRSKGLSAGIQTLQEMIAAQPGQPQLLALLAEWLKESGEAEAAVQTARLALQEQNGELSEQQRAALHLLIGLHMRSAGQLDQAIHHLSEAINHAPAHLEAYLELGRVYQDRREHRQALKVYQKAMSVAGNDYRPYYQAGLALKDSKDYLAAEAMLRRAAQMAPNEVSIHRLLGAVVALNLVHNRRIPPSEPAS